MTQPASKLDGDPARAPELRERLLKVAQVADWLNVSTRGVYRLIADGHFRCCKVGGALRVYERAVEEYLERITNLYELENGLPINHKR